MSIADHQRLKLLEQEVLALRARLELLENPPQKEPFVDPLPAFIKRGPGRPPKVRDGH